MEKENNFPGLIFDIRFHNILFKINVILLISC